MTLRKKIAWGFLIGFGLTALGTRIVFPTGIDHHLEDSLKWGFDGFGRSLWILIPWSSFGSLALSFGVSVLLFVTAFAISAVSLYLGQTGRSGLDRMVDFFLTFPSLLWSLGLAALLGPGWSTVSFALIAGSAPSLSRLFVQLVQEIEKTPYSQASLALGADATQLFRRAMLPELLRFTRLKFPSIFIQIIIAETTLNFLGLGAPLGSDTWGGILAQSKDVLMEAPWIAIFSAFPLFLICASLQSLSHLD
ncbi:MAG: ABC transporter permease subunit [Bdellovibrionales bacterium]|nr:ABC transporter permease subunit [Bdellovibrionales bacterium]